MDAQSQLYENGKALVCIKSVLTIVRKLEQTNSGSNMMKQIFRDLKNDNKNKTTAHKIHVKTQYGKKTTDGDEQNQSTI